MEIKYSMEVIVKIDETTNTETAVYSNAMAIKDGIVGNLDNEATVDIFSARIEQVFNNPLKLAGDIDELDTRA